MVVILLVSLTTFSQNATNNEPQVCLSVSKARRIAQDLVRLDSLTAEHNKTLFVLQKTIAKVEVKDSIIDANNKKIETYLKEISTHEYKDSICTQKVAKLETDVATLQSKNENLQGWVKGLGGGFIATFSIILTSLLLK